MFYILNEDGTARRTEDVREWGAAFSHAARIIALDVNRRYTVSTVFLGIDHAFGEAEPLLFETMVFVNSGFRGRDWGCERYSTIEAARAGHVRILRRWRWFYWCLPAVVGWSAIQSFGRRVLHALRG